MRRSREGFTLVELLIVIVVIGILAAIIVISYRGIKASAIEASLMSDLKNSSDDLMRDLIKNGRISGIPALVASSGNTLTYKQKPYGFCLLATNPGVTKEFAIKSLDVKIVEGNCETSGGAYTSDTASGLVDGPCENAKFFFKPNTNGNGGDAVFDSAGNMFVSDAGNQVIRKITPDCTVSTYAGTPGVAGTVNGPIATAQFNYPAQIEIDSKGNLIVGDRGNGGGVIRKITPDGIVSTIATVPMGRGGMMAIYRNTLYVTRDAFGGSVTLPHSITRLNLDTGVVEPFVGSGVSGYADGVGNEAQFNSLAGIAIDKHGTIYVADTDNHRIRKITQDGVVSTFAGTGVKGSTDGPALSATFANPKNVAVDRAGWVYTRGTGYYGGSYNDSRVRAITPEGKVISIYGSGSGTFAGSHGPYGLVVDYNFNIWVIQSDGMSVSNIFKIVQ